MESSDLTTTSFGLLSRLPSIAIGDGDDRTVELGAADAAAAMLAAEEAPLAIDGVAVGVAGGMAKDADGAAGLVPAHLAIVRDIAPDERAPARRPGRSLRPGAALEESVDTGGGIDALAEPGVEERKLVRGHAIPSRFRRLFRARYGSTGDRVMGDRCWVWEWPMSGRGVHAFAMPRVSPKESVMRATIRVPALSGPRTECHSARARAVLRPGKETVGVVLPGVVVETLGRSAVGGRRRRSGAAPRHGRAESEYPGERWSPCLRHRSGGGRVSVALELRGRGESDLAGGNGTVPLAPGAERSLPRATRSPPVKEHVWRCIMPAMPRRLCSTRRGRGNDSLCRVVPGCIRDVQCRDLCLSGGDDTGHAGMEACEPSAESLVHGVSPATSSMLRLMPMRRPLTARRPPGTGSRAEPTSSISPPSICPGYGDYFIPSSNQVTRQDERTTRIYYDAARSQKHQRLCLRG